VGANGFDIGSQFEDAPIGEFLAVPNLHQGEFTLGCGVDKHGSDDERTEVVSFSGFVDADAFNRVAAM
jgi:hypothetical protein